MQSIESWRTYDEVFSVSMETGQTVAKVIINTLRCLNLIFQFGHFQNRNYQMSSVKKLLKQRKRSESSSDGATNHEGMDVRKALDPLFLQRLQVRIPSIN